MKACVNATLRLRRGYCKWPIGQVHEPDFHYCMSKTNGPALSYCPAHTLGKRRPPNNPTAKANILGPQIPAAVKLSGTISLQTLELL